MNYEHIATAHPTVGILIGALLASLSVLFLGLNFVTEKPEKGFSLACYVCSSITGVCFVNQLFDQVSNEYSYLIIVMGITAAVLLIGIPRYRLRQPPYTLKTLWADPRFRQTLRLVGVVFVCVSLAGKIRYDSRSTGTPINDAMQVEQNDAADRALLDSLRNVNP